jgi:hypothetical protein
MRARRATCLLCGTLVTFGVAVRAATGQHAGQQPPRGSGTVTVASGRGFVGEVDPRTDENRLWLRWSHGTIAVLRPIDWQRVVQADFADKTFSRDELRRAVVQPADPATEVREPGVRRRRIVRVHAGLGGDSGLADPTVSPPRPAEASTVGAGPRRSPRITCLAMDASAANWDSDVEMDGLLVQLHPLDATGEVVPVKGTLAVTLIGWRTGRTRSRQPPVRLARWTRAVHPDDLGPLGIEYRLPFQSVHPEFDLRWASQGTVHARLNASGQGVFASTDSTVRIRPSSALRDHLEYVSGGRFFPVERTGRGDR